MPKEYKAMVVGLDIGTAKVMVVVAEVLPGGELKLAGLGIALKSTWDVRRHLSSGSLVSLLPGYSFDSDVAIYAVYPHRRHLPAKTRAFIDFLASSFGPEPFWDRVVVKPRIKARSGSAP
mgnify:CR=1 FL=1